MCSATSSIFELTMTGSVSDHDGLIGSAYGCEYVSRARLSIRRSQVDCHYCSSKTINRCLVLQSVNTSHEIKPERGYLMTDCLIVSFVSEEYTFSLIGCAIASCYVLVVLGNRNYG